jgi:hypothetical protein
LAVRFTQEQQSEERQLFNAALSQRAEDEAAVVVADAATS